jgi:hypothetical protein
MFNKTDGASPQDTAFPIVAFLDKPLGKVVVNATFPDPTAPATMTGFEPSVAKTERLLQTDEKCP